MILLIGNYRLDAQMSMLKYFEFLKRELTGRGIRVQGIEPDPIAGRLLQRGPAVKWIRYVDKYILFPCKLRRLKREYSGKSPLIVHITDHSNSVYVPCFRNLPVAVTCHDLLAVRGALGEDTDCPASRFGRLLQQKIMSGIARATRVICVSAATRRDFIRLVGSGAQERSEVVPLALNAGFRRTTENEARRVLREHAPGGLYDRPFLLHVGSALKRKNREGILRIFARMRKAGWGGRLVFAGEALDVAQLKTRDELGLRDGVDHVPSPPTEVINALYNLAFALVFPSTSEGFGWPIIEAQACGCPVICSDTTSLPEVAGKGALVRAIHDEAGFAEDLLRLEDAAFRAAVVRAGFENLKRFGTDGVIDRYCEIYQNLGLAA